MVMKWFRRLFGRGAPDANGAGGMISCDEALERLYEFLDEELDDGWQSRVEKHFNACKACFPVMRFEESFLKSVQSARVETTTPEEVKNRILEALAKEGLEPR